MITTACEEASKDYSDRKLSMNSICDQESIGRWDIHKPSLPIRYRSHLRENVDLDSVCAVIIFRDFRDRAVSYMDQHQLQNVDEWQYPKLLHQHLMRDIRGMYSLSTSFHSLIVLFSPQSLRERQWCGSTFMGIWRWSIHCYFSICSMRIW